MKKEKADFSLMIRDYEYVKRVIDNEDNRYEHLSTIHMLIVNFRRKWFGIKWKEYLYDLRDRWLALDEKLFEQRVENKTKK